MEVGGGGRVLTTAGIFSTVLRTGRPGRADFFLKFVFAADCIRNLLKLSWKTRKKKLEILLACGGLFLIMNYIFVFLP